MTGWQSDEALLSCTTEIERMFLDAAEYRMIWFPQTDYLTCCRIGYRIRVRGQEYGILLSCDIDDMDDADFRRDATQVLALNALDTIRALLNGGVRT